MNKIKEYRLMKKLTVRELSDITNIAVGYISNLENNKVNNPTRVVMIKLANALDKTAPEVFFPDELKEVTN
jgi:transcriptional regulator with XRE-family HTH domain